MKADRWRQIKDVLDKTVALGAADRLLYLDEVCAADPDLRREVESLLISHERAGSGFLQTPAVELLGSTAAGDRPSARVGRRVGVYQIVDEIAHGGMGEVYRAARVDGQYEKEVAIKLVRVGLDTSFILERFRQERQILASLDHPNIARLLDGGTTEDGIPYLVMELVDGTPIDQYCDANNLSISERLQLFRKVCAAVQYAHQWLVIHRDIKPGNILVTKDGTPKLLDFGIAKILDPAASSEETLAHPLTPEYASPEQIQGETITTASDVYSLGVVLYQLLTGQSPYGGETRTPHQLARAVTEMEPAPPSTAILRPAQVQQGGQLSTLTPERLSRVCQGSPAKLRRRLVGDVDNIVLKSLRKEAQRRYASVEQFAEDIRRHLDGLPVTARKDAWNYRAGKFVRRHRISVAAAMLVMVAVLGGVAATIREARIAAANERRAEKRFNDVRKLANSLIFEMHDSIKDLPGSTPSRKLLVTRALEYLDSLSQEAKGDASLQRELAAAYQRIGDVQGQPRQANLGDPNGAAASYRKALAIRESLLEADPQNPELWRELVPSYGKLSDLLRDMGDLAGAIETSQKGLDAAQKAYDADPTNLTNRRLVAVYRMDHGYKQATAGGDRPAGLKNMQQGTALLQQIVSEHPDDLYARRILGLSYSRMAEILQADPKDRPQALVLYQEAIAIKQGLVAASPNNTDFRRLVAYDQFAKAELLADMNDTSGALSGDRAALSSFLQLAAADPANAQLKQDVAEVRGNFGELLTRTGDPVNGIKQLSLSLDTLGKTTSADKPQSPVGLIVLTDQFWLGKAHTLLASSTKISAGQKAEYCREAEFWFQKALIGYEFFREHPVSGYTGAGRIAEIQREMTRCRTSP